MLFYSFLQHFFHENKSEKQEIIKNSAVINPRCVLRQPAHYSAGTHHLRVIVWGELLVAGLLHLVNLLLQHRLYGLIVLLQLQLATTGEHMLIFTFTLNFLSASRNLQTYVWAFILHMRTKIAINP